MAPRMSTSEANAAAPRLPTEIVSHIVQDTLKANDTWRKDIRSLCLVSKEFLNPCQEVLFKCVTIRPPSETVDSEGVVRKGPNRAIRFLEVIALAPGLGKYVQSLHYQLSTRIHDNTEATTALAQLTQVRTLHIEYEEASKGKNKYLDWTPQKLKWSRAFQEKYRGLLDAFTVLFASESLKELVLKNIRVPADMIMKAMGVETLWLDGSAHCYTMIDGAPQNPISIKQLNLAGDAACYMGSLVAPGRPYPISFSQLRKLNIPFGGDDSEERAKEYILGQAANLQQLRLHTTDNHPFEPIGNVNTHKDPLRQLHVQAYTNLTALCIDIRFDIADPLNMIRDPFQGLCRKREYTLSKLKALQKLTVVIWIGGRAWRDMQMGNFMNPRWQKLDKILLPLGPDGPFANPQLRSVDMVVGVSGDCRSAPKQVVDVFGAEVRSRAHALPWLGSVMTKKKRGEVEASIKTTVKHQSCGNDACPYRETV